MALVSSPGPRTPRPELRSVEWPALAAEEGIDPRHKVVQVLLQRVRVHLRRASPAAPVRDAVSAHVARGVADERQSLHEVAEIAGIRGVTFPPRRGALSVSSCLGRVVRVHPWSRHNADDSKGPDAPVNFWRWVLDCEHRRRPATLVPATRSVPASMQDGCAGPSLASILSTVINLRGVSRVVYCSGRIACCA